ncbi:MAG: hypothetical protein U9P63_02755 [Patescibacteria group bacterium]|nr:hypothetical protein [Patescibacteria group bacterium]
MKITKVIKDYIIKKLRFGDSVPRELFELSDYFRHFKSINFEYKKGNDNRLIAVSDNFRYGSIVASGKDMKDLEKNIKDAILTAFDVPSVYDKEADIKKVSKARKEYAFA